MTGSSTRARPTTSPVSVVIQGDGWSHQFQGGASRQRRDPSGERVTAWIVIALVCATGGLALFDLFLLLSGLQ